MQVVVQKKRQVKQSLTSLFFAQLMNGTGHAGSSSHRPLGFGSRAAFVCHRTVAPNWDAATVVVRTTPQSFKPRPAGLFLCRPLGTPPGGPPAYLKRWAKLRSAMTTRMAATARTIPKTYASLAASGFGAMCPLLALDRCRHAGL